ncbi:MAG: RidA family protein [Planctomycetota bacterium]|jgi:enamine deaminase RidA (YjgF/YER057c/UK114 family)|nr:RidA family protein [Planctomycetota bacterium]MDP6763214.1 RidA family protein [Planctomycetota bacterium]MDP6990577.1 RidA family protein [Planctomycetota bacterium]
MSGRVIQPEGWDAPSGYANGILVEPGAKLLFVAGQVAWDERKQLVGEEDFVAQFAQALSNVVAVVRAAGGEPDDIARMLVMVTDKQAYLANLPALGAAWRECMGRHFPAMALVQVAGLVEEGALLEIEATAAIS